MDGGYGFTPPQVADMTMDQVFILLRDKDHLRKAPHKKTAFRPSEIPQNDTLKDTKRVFRGKSKCRELMEKKAEKDRIDREEKRKAKKEERRRRRGK